MKTIEFNSITYQVAENWSELTLAQYRELIACPRLNSKESRTLDNEAAACRIWLGMGKAPWNALVLAPHQWAALRKGFGWLFDTKPEGKPPMDVFCHKGVNYHLPAENFGDTTAIEIAFSNMAFVEFANPEGPDLNALDRLIATLCRPRRADWRKFQKSLEWNNDIRQEWTEQRMSEHAKSLATLDINTKLIILDYFERMNEEFLQQYGELFGGKKEPRYGDGRGWIMLLKNVAKEGHFGDFDKVCKTPAHLLFATLLDDLLDNQERSEQTPTPHENY